MNIYKDLPKIHTKDITDYLIINRCGVFTTKCVYIAEELSLKSTTTKQITNNIKEN